MAGVQIPCRAFLLFAGDVWWAAAWSRRLVAKGHTRHCTRQCRVLNLAGAPPPFTPTAALHWLGDRPPASGRGPSLQAGCEQGGPARKTEPSGEGCQQEEEHRPEPAAGATLRRRSPGPSAAQSGRSRGGSPRKSPPTARTRGPGPAIKSCSLAVPPSPRAHAAGSKTAGTAVMGRLQPSPLHSGRRPPVFILDRVQRSFGPE